MADLSEAVEERIKSAFDLSKIGKDIILKGTCTNAVKELPKSSDGQMCWARSAVGFDAVPHIEGGSPYELSFLGTSPQRDAVRPEFK